MSLAHGGLWIAMLGKRVVASDRTFDAVYAAIQSAGISESFITYVPEDAEFFEGLIA